MSSVSHKKITPVAWQRYARIRAAQALCALEAGDSAIMEHFSDFVGDDFDDAQLPEPGEALRVRILAESLVQGAWNHRAAFDARIAEHVRNWAPGRVGPVERNILRLAMYELFGEATVDEKPPAKVAMNEAIELAKYFVSEEAAAFVNGVLDAVYKSSPADAASTS